MIFIEPDGCFRQVSTTLGLFEGLRTLQTTFTKKYGQKSHFSQEIVLPALFKIQKFISVKKEHPNGLKEKSLQLTKKKCFNEKEISFFEVFHGFI